MTTPATTSVIHLTQRPPRPNDIHVQPGILPSFWIADQNSMYLSTGSDTMPSIPSSSSPLAGPTPRSSTGSVSRRDSISGADGSQFGANSSASGIIPATAESFTTFTSPFPVTTFSGSSVKSSSFGQSVVVRALPDTQSLQADTQIAPVCIGDGVDTLSLGLLSTLVLPTVIGFVIWLLFAIIRPRFRQVYGLREWFVQQNLRPKPLNRSLWAFLFPPVPLVPSIPSHGSDTGKSSARDSQLFPSDEQLGQRILYAVLLVVVGWSALALVGFLPLYLASIPCLARSASPSRFSGAYSTLQDISLLRLLQLLDAGSSSTGNTILGREIIDGHDFASAARARLIVATVIAIVLGVIPALWKFLKELNNLVAFRELWLDVRCQGQEMGWLSARSAPGFTGWGEKRLKDFIVKTGLSSKLETEQSNGRSRRRRTEQEWSAEEKAQLEIDIGSIFSIGNTTELALLIDERDEILENLEIAETKYIRSFRLTTPEPSIVDLPIPLSSPITGSSSSGSPKPQISRPRPLGGSQNRRRRRNPAFGSSSLPPTSFVMPSQYYQLRGVEGINGGHFTDPSDENLLGRRQPSLADSFNQRVVGSRFQEVERNSMAFGRLPMGSQVTVEKGGQLGPVLSESPLPDNALYGPNQGMHSSWDTTAFNEGMSQHDWLLYHPEETIPEEQDELNIPGDDGWVDVMTEAPEAFDNEGEHYPDNVTPRRRPRPLRVTPEERSESFPLRTRRKEHSEAGQVTPPHLRLQPRQPFVRPLSGLDHDDLGVIYADINLWRSKLKSINAAIALQQNDSYNDIADGTRIKGWLMVGRGLRFIPGIQLIEGRAKEDIRWDELQNEGTGAHRTVVFWTAIVMIVVCLGIALTAVAGLALGTAPGFSHYFPFLRPLAAGHRLGAGIATVLAPAIAATLFIAMALYVGHQAAQQSTLVSISGIQLFTLKMIFYIIIAIAAIWFFTIGAVLFAFGAFSTSSRESDTVANGAIYLSVLAMAMVLNVAIIVPGLLLLQPIHLWRVLRAERDAMTPRQRFRAVYPITYDPSYAMACCVLGFVFASAFSLVFPVIGLAVVVLVFLSLIAHRYLVGYVYGRTHSQTGGLLYIWMLRRLASIVAFQPLVFGLILLSRRLWVEGGILCGVALFVVLFVEGYCSWRVRGPGLKSLSAVTRDSLETFRTTAKPKKRSVDEEGASLFSSGRNTRTRGSFASVLEMMSLTLVVMPSASQSRGPVPLATETLDDLTATERAARTNPDAPPHLPPLPFADHAEEMTGILYAPELLAPAPVIWLPNDQGGIGRAEAYDLQKYHNLRVTLDVRAKEDMSSRRVSSPS